MSIHENPLHRPVIHPQPRTRILPPAASGPASPAIVFGGRFRPVASPIEGVARSVSDTLPELSSVPVRASPQADKPARKRGDRTGPNFDENSDYLVGRSRPPVEHRFQEGGTGNKKGPKVGEVDFIKAMNKELGKKLPIKLGGKRVSLNAIQLIAHNLRAMIIEKNLGAMKVAAQWRMMGEAQGGGAIAPSVSAEQLAIIDELLSEAGYDANPVMREAPGAHGS